jgi:hypothetical protein
VRGSLVGLPVAPQAMGAAVRNSGGIIVLRVAGSVR